MARDSVIQIRLSPELKRDADKLFEEMGLDTASAIRLFLKQSVIRDKLPFRIKRYASDKKKKEEKAQPSTEGILSAGGEPDPIINDLY